MRAILVIFKKLPKVNSPPMGGNSPNLVTLAGTEVKQLREENL
jgi:hypothetical protein